MSSDLARSAVLENVRKLISEKLFHPWWDVREIEEKAATLPALSRELATIPEDQFERRLNAWLAEFGLSHTAYFHVAGRSVPPQFAIGAELRSFPNGDGYAWLVQHVAEGGVARQAGVRLGDAFLAIDGQKIVPPDEPRFQLGRAHEILLQPRDESQPRTIRLELPKGTMKDRPPIVASRPLSHEMLESGIGIIRVSTFPGAVGLDFARALDGIVEEFKSKRCDRLIIDLRGNPGGGLGSLRVMSYLVADRRPTGYSLTRRGKANRLGLQELAQIKRIPRTKLGLWSMALRFGLLHRDRSLSLWTEKLGQQPFHGKIVLLVDEFTRSAAEMIAAFASKAKLATLVGAPTPGQVLGAANFKVGADYRLRIPVTAWYMWDGELIEGKGVAPDNEIRPSLEDLQAGSDVQLKRAISVATVL